MISLVRASLLAAALVAFGAPCAFAGTLTNATRPVVVELFTSQGCSSCPPADALMGRLAQRSDVIAISLPITYWDMLGWKDTLASDANTRRQKAYAAAMGHGGVYTPQIIVDGAFDVVGSRTTNVEIAIAQRRAVIANANAMIMAEHSAAMAARIASAQAAARAAAGAHAETVGAVTAFDSPMAAAPPPPAPRHTIEPVVPVVLNETPQEMHIDIGEVPGAHNATVWLFHLRSQVSVNIPAGENSGHTITYHNVVGDLKAIGVYKGRALTLTLPRAAMSAMPHDGVAVIVQQGGYGHVIGAAYVSHPDYYAQR